MPFALSGGVRTLRRLATARRGGAGVRDAAAALLCAVAQHGELLMHCLQHGVLGAHPPRARAPRPPPRPPRPPRAWSALIAHLPPGTIMWGC